MTQTCPFQPFIITLNDDNHSEVRCEQRLRNLPGKRAVYRGIWQQREVLIKLFLHPQAAQRHRDREQRGSHWLSSCRIATPALIFCGTLQDKTPLLIYEYLTNSCSVEQRWQQPLAQPQRHALLQQLAALIARQHDCGLWQEDLHLGNFLIKDSSLYAIDGDGIRCQKVGRSLSAGQRRKNLALFLAQLNPADAAFFPVVIEHYLHCCTAVATVDSTWHKQLQQQLGKAQTRRRRRYVEKSLRSCSEFVRQRRHGQISIYRRDAPEELIAQLLSDPDALVQNGTCLKDGHSATVVHLHTEQGDWVVKRYNIKNLWHALKRCWRPTRAAVSWGNAHRLLISGIATPQPVAMIEKRFGPLRYTGYYVSQWVTAPSAAEFFSAAALATDEQKRTAKQLVQLFALFYRLGIYHGDCKATNFLIQDTAPWVIDLDAMGEFRCRRRFIQHYRQDRQRFLRNWQPDSPLRSWFDARLPR